MKTRLLVVFAKYDSVMMSMKPMDENGLPVPSAMLGSTMNVKDLRQHLVVLLHLFAFLVKTPSNWLLSKSGRN